MKLSILSAATAALIAATATSASALPLAKPGQIAAEKTTMTEQVAHRPGHYGKKRWKPRHDNRYDQYRGWQRYSHRPHGWRSRGCVAVGPIWFCK